SRRSGRGVDQLGDFVTSALASFGLAVLIVEGLLPGFWMIAGYALYGGTLEDHLLPGTSVSSLLRTLAVGPVVSPYAAGRAARVHQHHHVAPLAHPPQPPRPSWLLRRGGRRD